MKRNSEEGEGTAIEFEISKMDSVSCAMALASLYRRSGFWAVALVSLYSTVLSVLWWVYFNVSSDDMVLGAIAGAVLSAIFGAAAYVRTCVDGAARIAIEGTKKHQNEARTVAGKDHDVITGDSTVPHKL